MGEQPPRTALEWCRAVAAAKGITGPTRAVLWAMAYHAGETNRVWASKATIAEECGLGLSSVQKAWTLIESKGWATRRPRRGCSDEWVLHPGKWPTDPPPKRKQQGGRKRTEGCHATGEGCDTTGLPRNGGRVATQPGGVATQRGEGCDTTPNQSMNRSLNRSVNTHSARDPHRQTVSGSGVCPDPGHPRWLTRAADRLGWSSADVHRVLAGAVEAITGEPSPPTKADADVLASLVDVHATRAPGDVLADIRLVADACHRSPVWRFARTVRGQPMSRDGDRWADNSRSVDLVLRPKHWRDRLRDAEAWDRDGRPVDPAVAIGPDAEPDHAQEVDWCAERIREAIETGRTLRPIACPWVAGTALSEDPDQHDRWWLAVMLATDGEPEILPGLMATSRERVIASWALAPGELADQIQTAGPAAVACRMLPGVDPAPEDTELAARVAEAREAGHLVGAVGLVTALADRGTLYVQPSVWSDPAALALAVREVRQTLDAEHDGWRDDPYEAARQLGLTLNPPPLVALRGGRNG